jgi:hypothetical protein
MNVVDYHYYESLTDVERTFYDWERQFINLGCKISDISINEDLSLTQNGNKEVSKLVHEYIHFLQNFAFTWGVPVFTDFSLANLKIGASSAVSTEKYSLPFDESKVTNQLLLDGLQMRKTVIERMQESDSYTIQSQGVLLPISIDLSHPDFVKFNNGLLKVQLGMKVIREHMAHMGTQLFLAKSDEEIHFVHEEFNGFKNAGISFGAGPEYWIIFEYLYEQKRFKGISRGLFYLMQQSLVSLKPVALVRHFFLWLQSNLNTLPDSNIDLTGIIRYWIQQQNIIDAQDQNIQKAIQHCKDICNLCNSHRAEHDFYKFVYEISKNSLDHLTSSQGGRTLFSPEDNFSDFNYWKNLMIRCGTGIVRYLDGTLIHGTSGYLQSMYDSFVTLLSSSIALKKILENRIGTCPFLFDIPICNASFKESEGCFKNPYMMSNPQTDSEEQCLFRNATLLMGFQDRIIFK